MLRYKITRGSGGIYRQKCLVENTQNEPVAWRIERSDKDKKIIKKYTETI